MNYNDYFKDDGEPIKCPFCDCNQFKGRIIEKIEGTEYEYELICVECSFELTYRCYGYHDTEYSNDVFEKCKRLREGQDWRPDRMIPEDNY